jgi:hypothetical protein
MRNAYQSLMRSLLAWRINGYATQRQQINDNINAARAEYARIEQKEAQARHNYRSLT